jgi:chemotaxis protein methyltransferase CheR
VKLTAQEFAYVADLVNREAAIVLVPGKEYLVESRLIPLARRTGHCTLTGLIGVARTTTYAARELRQQIVESLTVNETSWFRDREPFMALTDVVLPAVLADSVARPLRIWSAACSSGQEPYSIAIQLEKSLPAGRGHEIVATDLSTDMIDRASRGVYNQLEVNRGLPAADLVQYFQRDGVGWHVNDRIRRHVSFRQLNLAAPLPPMAPFDVVFLRNVLIYFAPETKRLILGRIRRLLRPGGWLLLGAAESTVGIDPNYERVPVGRTAVYRAPTNDRNWSKEVKAC